MKNSKYVLSVLSSIVVVVILSVFGATSAGLKPYDPTLMASWVQAIGAIAAILAAIFVADQSRKSDQAERKKHLRQERVRTLMYLSVLVSELRDVLSEEARYRSNTLHTDTATRRKQKARVIENIHFAFHEFSLERIPSFEVMKTVMQLRALVDAAKDLSHEHAGRDHISCDPTYGAPWIALFEHVDLALQIIKETSEGLP